MFYNYRWSINITTCESLYYTPVTYNITHHMYFNFLKIRRKKMKNMSKKNNN